MPKAISSSFKQTTLVKCRNFCVTYQEKVSSTRGKNDKTDEIHLKVLQMETFVLISLCFKIRYRGIVMHFSCCIRFGK